MARSAVLRQGVMKDAVALFAKGYTAKRVAEECHVSPSTASRWMNNPEVTAAIAKAMHTKAMRRVCRAYQLLEEQMEDPNPWVAQAAAKALIDKQSHVAFPEDANDDNLVRIEGLPKLGVPDGTVGREDVDAVDAADEDGEIEIEAEIK